MLNCVHTLVSLTEKHTKRPTVCHTYASINNTWTISFSRERGTLFERKVLVWLLFAIFKWIAIPNTTGFLQKYWKSLGSD